VACRNARHGQDGDKISDLPIVWDERGDSQDDHASDEHRSKKHREFELFVEEK
jgi:hypothetical protein